MTSVLDRLAVPPHWERHPFGRLVRRSKEAGRPELDPLSVFLDAGVVPRSARDDNFNKLGESLDKYLVVRPGDLVFNKLRTWQGGLGVSRYEGIVSPAYFVCRPREDLDPRFAHYLLKSVPYLAELTRVSKFMPPSQFDIAWDDLRQLPVLLPSIAVQREIADYLETETVRIEALISKKQRLIALLEERFWVAVSDAIRACHAPMVPLRRFIEQITDGPFGSSLTSSHYVEEGPRVVRLGNIGFAEFRNADRAHISESHYQALLRHQVVPGDLLIAGLGDQKNHVGRAAVAPDLGPAIVKADCYCARLDRSVMQPEFVALFLSSPLGAVEVSQAARGTTRSRINLEIAKHVLVPAATLTAQRTVMARASQLRTTLHATQRRLTDQVDLLAERRQALITAAVTGELEIPRATSSD